MSGHPGPHGPNGQAPGGHAMQISVNLNDCQDLKCEKCGCIFFTDEKRFKIISALISPTKEEQLVTLQVQRCSDCGHRVWNKDIDGPKKNEKNTNGKG